MVWYSSTTKLVLAESACMWSVKITVNAIKCVTISHEPDGVDGPLLRGYGNYCLLCWTRDHNMHAISAETILLFGAACIYSP